MTESVTVITAAIPERLPMLAEACASVTAQTLQPHAHLIAIDHARQGGAQVRTQLAMNVRTRWTAVLDDDDLFDPHHLQTLMANADGADVVYTFCRVEGRDWNPNRHFDAEALQYGNYIPTTALYRTSLIRALGGWREDATPTGWWDWDFWKRAVAVGAHFISVANVSWTYRFHGGNMSYGGVMVA